MRNEDGRHVARGWPATATRVARRAEQRGGEGVRLTDGPGRGKKQIEFEIRKEGVPELKNSPNFYWR